MRSIISLFMLNITIKLLFVVNLLNAQWWNQSASPHIIIIVADDLGWNDVGFHGLNQIPTPNIDALAYSGIILNNYYVQSICTPSRSSLMTGRHPIHTGMQHYVLLDGSPYGLPLTEKLLPQYLSEHLGYETHTVGKWHLGSYRAAYTPTKRGFQSHMGYWNGRLGYYDHTFMKFGSGVETTWCYDFRRNMSIANNFEFGVYATDVFTNEAVSIIQRHNTRDKKPLFLYLAHLAVHSGNIFRSLEAPEEYIKRFAYITNKKRRIYAAMLSKLDESVGQVIKALKENSMLDNSIIFFTTDNGGAAAGYDNNHASNWPLRGGKNTLWEGGIRGTGVIWSPLLKSAPRISTQMMNIEDWLPTLFFAAGGSSRDLSPRLDGINLWKSLSENTASPRNLMLHNIDPIGKFSSLRVGDWKIHKGSYLGGSWDGWYGPSGRKDMTYDWNKVYKSETAQAMSAIGRSLSSVSFLKSIRNEAIVRCEKPNKDQETCNLRQQVCLFNITADPCERNNLVFKFPSVIKAMEQTLRLFESTAVTPRNKPNDPRSNPKFFNYTCTNWMDFIEPKSEEQVIREDEAETNHVNQIEADQRNQQILHILKENNLI